MFTTIIINRRRKMNGNKQKLFIKCNRFNKIKIEIMKTKNDNNNKLTSKNDTNIEQRERKKNFVLFSVLCCL